MTQSAPLRARKNPLRILRYGAYLLAHEFFQGTAAQKRRFVGRVMRRFLRRLGFQKLVACFFWLYCFCTLQEKQVRWLWAIRGLDNRLELKEWVMDRTVPHIVILGMGSIGDVLQITPVLRALRQILPSADISLLHRSPAAAMVLQGNSNINSVAVADFHQFAAIKRAVEVEGVADLVVEIQSMNFVLSYTRAPQKLRHPSLDAAMDDSFFATAENVRQHWQAPRGFQRDDGTFAWPDEWAHFQYLDVLGMTGNLPIHTHSHLDFYPDKDATAVVRELPQGMPIITVQAGVDGDVEAWAHVTGQRPTKLMPLVTWYDVVRRLREKGFALVQLGTPQDAAIEGVTLDLRGKTNLAEAAVVLKQATCHLGTEGGLVHLARAMQTKSVVLFGPTPAAFLGYPGNINLVASDCTGCWGATKDWYIYCPRGFKEAPCMNAFRAETLIQAVEEIGRAADLQRLQG